MTTKRVTYRERPQPNDWTHVQTSLIKAIGVDYAGSGMPDAWYISRLLIDRQLQPRAGRCARTPDSRMLGAGEGAEESRIFIIPAALAIDGQGS